jgi:hypothetical protein
MKTVVKNIFDNFLWVHFVNEAILLFWENHKIANLLRNAIMTLLKKMFHLPKGIFQQLGHKNPIYHGSQYQKITFS